jgi:hypothetical protein
MNFNSLASPWTEEHIQKKWPTSISIPFGRRSNLKRKATFVDIPLGQKSTPEKKMFDELQLIDIPLQQSTLGKKMADEAHQRPPWTKEHILKKWPMSFSSLTSPLDKGAHSKNKKPMS